MTEQTDFQILGEETREYFERYMGVIEPFRTELWNYCRRITGSPWDAEDLFQDTILKLFTSLSALSHRAQPIHPRSFLFRVATNHWIDQCRKRKLQLDELREDQVQSADHDPFDTRHAFESLLSYLPPRQVVVWVLTEVYGFTARETAAIIATTEGAVNASLHRARRNLAILRAQTGRMEGTSTQAPNTVPSALVERYVELFNNHDIQGIADLLADEAVFSFVTQASKEYGKRTIMEASHNPDRHRPTNQRLLIRDLWGKESVITFIVASDGTPIALDDVCTLEVEDDKIVSINCYYFCPDFMEAAAIELRVPRAKWEWAE